jgi:8-oxo-dGTP diphosphatase
MFFFELRRQYFSIFGYKLLHSPGKHRMITVQMVFHSLRIVSLRSVFRLLELATLGNFPPFTAVCAVIGKEGQLLLVERADYLGYCLPGGLLKTRETPQEALRREVFEETGYLISINEFIGVYSNPQSDPRFKCVQLAYHAIIDGGHLRGSAEGNAVWQDLNQLPEPLAFEHSTIIDHFFNGKIGMDILSKREES